MFSRYELSRTRGSCDSGSADSSPGQHETLGDERCQQLVVSLKDMFTIFQQQSGIHVSIETGMLAM